MKIEAIAVGSHGVDLIPSDRHWEGQHFSCRTTEMRDEWIRLINAGQAALEREEARKASDNRAKERWVAEDRLGIVGDEPINIGKEHCRICGGKGTVPIPCPDAKPGSSITCGVLHYGPCPACAPAAERAERYGKLRDKLDEWTDADKWEQRRWELVSKLALSEKWASYEELVRQADALIAEFRKGEAKA